MRSAPRASLPPEGIAGYHGDMRLPASGVRRLPQLRRPRPDAGLAPAVAGRQTVRVVLVKPSKYDDAGAVLSFRWGVLPSNTLIVLAGIVAAYAAARPHLDVQTVLWDEVVDGAVSPAIVDALVADARRDGVVLLVGLVAVQTNQYPRARDLALQLRALGAAVAMGGFHPSSHAASRGFLASAGVTTVIGESEHTFARLLDDLCAGRLEACYRVEDGLRARTGMADILVPPIDEAPLPAVSPRYLQSFLNPAFSTIDTSRGCPFVCSFCSVKNVMGRTMRVRDPARVVQWMRDVHDRYGIRNLLVVDDDFYRSPGWREVLRGVAALRREGRSLWLLMQVDVESSLGAAAAGDEARGRRGREFVELAAAAGCFQVFIGLESLDPRNLAAVAKTQNQGRQSDAAQVKERYRQAVDAWHAAGVAVHAGYIIGLPHDTAGCGRRAARDLADVGVDLASFFAYTPFPGTEDYDAFLAAGLIHDHDFDRYDSTHVVMRHPSLGAADLDREYREAWRAFYTWRRLAWSLGTAHRTAGLGVAARAAMLTHTLYYTYSERRGWHPMIGGVWRRPWRVRREVVSDAEALRRYLPASQPGATRGGEPMSPAAASPVTSV